MIHVRPPRLDDDQRKQLETATLIAAASAVVTGIIGLGFDELRAWRARRAAQPPTDPTA